MYKKLSYGKFLGKLKIDVLKDFKHSENGVCVPTDKTDQTIDYRSKCMHRDLTEEEKKKELKQKVW